MKMMTFAKRCAKEILRDMGYYDKGPTYIVCPTCGRTKIDLISLVAAFEQRAKEEQLMDLPLKVAIMGCVVNGPGEAREADIGIAGGDGCGLLFKKGEVFRKVPEEQLLDALMEEVERL